MDISFDSKEIAWIIVALIIFEFLVIYPLTTYNPLILLTPVLILAANLIAKKIAAPFSNIKIRYKIWEFQRYGFQERAHFKKPFPIGLVFPFVIAFLSLGLIKIPLLLQFDYKNLLSKRLLKHSGTERRTEINESDLAAVASWGFYSILALAILGSIPAINIIFPQLALYSIVYGLWNLIPFGNLDGSRLFFGSKVGWFILAIFFILGLILVLI